MIRNPVHLVFGPLLRGQTLLCPQLCLPTNKCLPTNNTSDKEAGSSLSGPSACLDIMQYRSISFPRILQQTRKPCMAVRPQLFRIYHPGLHCLPFSVRCISGDLEISE
ncbi:hypothetical protein PAXRUDRAFT_829234 [Paxillus rubicundulus Ve08.2h10]|uniref:Uncharacterized protein n=1 Tax=Paxillus rubicundulus Ve08.2h10 TaxID=930991 RepID=A0A0D0D885_9AGAM|nr:hypothetical protein PAXRUDRAFT_829234 [Paxillus rubicundulus Ve08.2h10]